MKPERLGCASPLIVILAGLLVLSVVVAGGQSAPEPGAAAPTPAGQMRSVE